MGRKTEWMTLPDAVYVAAGRVSRWQLYTAAMERRIESRRQGRVWEVRRDSLDRYLSQLQSAS